MGASGWIAYTRVGPKRVSTVILRPLSGSPYYETATNRADGHGFCVAASSMPTEKEGLDEHEQEVKKLEVADGLERVDWDEEIGGFPDGER